MADTKIEWCDRVWNPISGCTPISEGCQHCYAQRMSKRLAGRYGYPKDKPFGVTLHLDKLEEPSNWNKPKRIFVCSMGDLFHEDVPFDYLDKVFAYMALYSQHTFLLLTKRPKRMKEYILTAMYDENCGYEGWYEQIDELGIPDEAPMSNVWLGVTAENQQRADERIPILLQTPAAVRFVSVEPMLGPVDLTDLPDGLNALATIGVDPGPHGEGVQYPIKPLLDWVICGGETGPGARPLRPDWVKSLRDQCQTAGTPFFFKSWGEWAPDGNSYSPVLRRVGKKNAGRLLDGQEYSEYPEARP